MRTAALVALLCAIWMLCGFSAPHLVNSADVPSFDVGQPELKAIKGSQLGPVTSRSAVLMDMGTNRFLYEKQPHLRLAPASTTKMMTALLTLEHGGLNETVAIDSLAAGQVGSRMGLEAGESFTVLQLLYGLLLPSGNDAAVALAEHVGGSVNAFVTDMNRRASQLGLNDTHWANPDGLDDPNHYSSARDLAELGRFALDSQPIFAEIVRTKTYAMSASSDHPTFELTNLNHLLTTYAGADGVKTGTTPEAGEALVGSATRQGHRLLVVVLGSQDRYADADALLDYGFRNYVWLKATNYVAGLSLTLATSTAPPIPRWEASQVHVFFNLNEMTADFSLLGRQVLSVPILTAGPQLQQTPGP